MKIGFHVLLLSSALSIGCDSTSNAGASSAKPADTTKVDNTKKNERDSADAAKTPGDQAENSADITITADIRKAVVGADGMSMNAKNVKIITKDGVVTLRGPVASAAEKDSIGQLATKTSGVKRVDNQLEVKTD